VHVVLLKELDFSVLQEHCSICLSRTYWGSVWLT